MNMELVAANKRDVMQKGLLTMDNANALVAQAKAHMETFGELPRLCKSEGSMPLHKQAQKIFFEKSHGMEFSFDHEAGYISLTNKTSNTIAMVDFESNDSDRVLGMAVEKFDVNENDTQEFPHLARQLGRLRIIDTGDVPLEQTAKDYLAEVNPNAIWVEKSEMKDADFVFLEKIVEHGNNRKDLLQEFESNTGPMMLNPTQHRQYDDGGMSL